jgi:hypothetical protein
MTSATRNIEKLKIFTDFSMLSDLLPIEPILYPFCEPSNSDFVFENHRKLGSEFLSFSSLEESDIVVVPTNWEALLSTGQAEVATQLILQARRLKKITVSFFGGDCSHLKLPIETDIIFRQSLYDFIKKPNDFAYPAWSEDILTKYTHRELRIRTKSDNPVIGFCGFVNRTRVKTHIKYHVLSTLGKTQKVFGLKRLPPYSSGHILRAKALATLSGAAGIDTNFILRDASFFADKRQRDTEQNRADFVENLLESDYVLCPRGSGNYSFRFYEALCCGRVPVFINTHCVLPYDFEINWRQYCVWIEESDLPRIGEKILEFHERLSPQEFIDLQRQCRQLWEDYIEPSSFFKNLHRHIGSHVKHHASS